MAQHKPAPITSAIQVADENELAVPDIASLRGQARGSVPARTQVLAERQFIDQVFITERATHAIRRSAKVHDEAGAEAAQSFDFTNRIRRAYGDDFNDVQHATLNELDRAFGHGLATIANESIEALTNQAANGKRPSTEVTDWDVLCRWTKNKLT